MATKQDYVPDAAYRGAGLMNRAEHFEVARRQAVEELEKKHAFERG